MEHTDIDIDQDPQWVLKGEERLRTGSYSHYHECCAYETWLLYENKVTGEIVKKKKPI
jgi:hypothetical protein